jgi:hypothetical protein
MAKKQRSTDGQMENGLIMLFGSACLALVQYIFLAAIIISTNHAAAKSITDKQHMCEAFFNSFMYHQRDLYTLTTHLIFKFHLHPHVRLLKRQTATTYATPLPKQCDVVQQIKIWYEPNKFKQKPSQKYCTKRSLEQDREGSVNDLLDAAEDPLDSIHNQGEATFSPEDDEICTQPRIYNPLSSYNIGILVDQVSQEIHFLPAPHIEAQGMNWICRVTTFPDFLHCLHLVEKFHRFVEPQVIAADSEKMEHM